MVKLNTPLRYPGGKSKLIKKMVPYLPDMTHITEYREPFLGGGSMAIYITQQYPDIKVWVNDLYTPLINFWQQLQKDGDRLAEKLMEYKADNNTPERVHSLYLLCKTMMHDDDIADWYRAAAFYVVNKCSFSGSTESGGYSKAAAEGRFTIKSIAKLPLYAKLIKNWTITNHSYQALLFGDEKTFTYCDPPYEIKQSLYGHKGSMQDGFDHGQFAHYMSFSNQGPTMISYNSSNFIKDRFINWKAVELDHPYSMVSQGTYRKDQAKRKELILLNS